jgi:hypothetical protein
MARHLGALEVEFTWMEVLPPKPPGVTTTNKKREKTREVSQAADTAEDLMLTRMNGWSEITLDMARIAAQAGAPLCLSKDGHHVFTWNEVAETIDRGMDESSSNYEVVKRVRGLPVATRGFWPPRQPDAFFNVQRDPHVKRRRWPHDYPDMMQRVQTRGGRPNDDLDGLGADVDDPGRISIRDMEMWIDNDEGLYSWWKSTRLPKRAFIMGNRAEITAVIRNITSGSKRAHYLIYDKPKGPLNGLRRRRSRR